MTINDVILPANYIIAGATNSGKTYFTKNTLLPLLKGKYDYLVICSPTMELSGDFSEFEPSNRLFKLSKEEDIVRGVQQAIEDQENNFTLLKQHLIKRNNIPNIVVILDDCISIQGLFGVNGILSNWIYKNRHIKLSFVIMTQRICSIPRIVRLNSAYFFLFSCCNYSEIERMLIEYVPASKKQRFKERVEEIYDEKYNYIFINNLEQSVRKRMFINGTTPFLQEI